MPRDPRLDFFRGLAMFIIFIAHVPDNPWTLDPGRFGFSDATEMFVFCSGMASAFAFGGSSWRQGWLIGTPAHPPPRLADLLVAYRPVPDRGRHPGAARHPAVRGAAMSTSLNLEPFFADPNAGLAGLMTLSYVPNYFDMLPMYFGILLMLPAVVALHRSASGRRRWRWQRSGWRRSSAG